MLTRCPACTTTFRITPDQLKARAGMVRCGKCQHVFNALDTLVEASPAAVTTPAPEAIPAAPPAQPPTPAPSVDTPPRPAEPQGSGSENAPISGESVDILLENVASNTETEALPTTATEAPEAASSEPLSPEALRDTVVAAGLVAARETTEAPGYNKWAEGAFTGAATIAEPPTRTTWPFILAAIILIGALTGQLAHHFRAELAVGSPGLRPLLETGCAILECDIPLPRHSELVSIESSDLQIDPTRGGMLTLSATLKNRAAYAQSWPLLEITLTDVQDNAVLRRVLEPAEYLPPKADPTIFPPNGEVGVRLWLEAKETAAAGYRLYVFYP